jgi:hypothetical protein
MLISAEGRANATLSAALEEVKGINAEFTETAQMYREFRATTGLDSAHFVKGYLAHTAAACALHAACVVCPSLLNECSLSRGLNGVTSRRRNS